MGLLGRLFRGEAGQDRGAQVGGLGGRRWQHPAFSAAAFERLDWGIRGAAEIGDELKGMREREFGEAELMEVIREAADQVA